MVTLSFFEELLSCSMQRRELDKIIKKIDSAIFLRNQSFFITLFPYLYKLKELTCAKNGLWRASACFVVIFSDGCGALVVILSLEKKNKNNI